MGSGTAGRRTGASAPGAEEVSVSCTGVNLPFSAVRFVVPLAEGGLPAGRLRGSPWVGWSGSGPVAETRWFPCVLLFVRQNPP